MRHITGVALMLLLTGAGSSLVGFSALVAGLSIRQAVRAAPIHPFGAAAGLLALPLGLAIWLLARRALHHVTDTEFQSWTLREQP